MNSKNIKSLVLVMFTLLMFSCSNSIDLTSVDESQYHKAEQNLAFITDKYGISNADSLLFNESGSTDFYVNLCDAAATQQSFTISYDAKVLADYNAAHGTAIQALPENLVTIGGSATMAAGEKQSDAVSVSYKTADELIKNGVYAIPLKVTGTGAQTSEEKGDFVLFVRDITKMPNCHKEGGLQVISCMEINDANPLYNLCFTLENSGKYFFDQVILFSGNINYNAETQEVYNYNNENITQCLRYKEKYLKPLQEKGMKVILGILGNHDRSSITRLNDEGCKAFAAELAANVYAYELDGVFFDDEYSSPGNYPGFVRYNNFSRLAYECKQAMPDKLVEAYVLSGTRSAEAVEDKQPGDFIDYGIHDYGGSKDLSSNYPGMPKTGMIMNSIECAQDYFGDAEDYQYIRINGYGGTMFFALAPNRTPMDMLNCVAQAFYGENVVRTGTYEKDW